MAGFQRHGGLLISRVQVSALEVADVPVRRIGAGLLGPFGRKRLEGFALLELFDQGHSLGMRHAVSGWICDDLELNLRHLDLIGEIWQGILVLLVEGDDVVVRDLDASHILLAHLGANAVIAHLPQDAQSHVAGLQTKMGLQTLPERLFSPEGRLHVLHLALDIS